MNTLSSSTQYLIDYACRACGGKLARAKDTEMVCAFTVSSDADVFMQYVANYMLQTEMRSAINSNLIYVQVTSSV